tara:strand:- start:107 stop:445 length:339 start_codon:yes stop_codon:yes gene_type:complete
MDAGSAGFIIDSGFALVGHKQSTVMYGHRESPVRKFSACDPLLVAFVHVGPTAIRCAVVGSEGVELAAIGGQASETGVFTGLATVLPFLVAQIAIHPTISLLQQSFFNGTVG